MKLLLFYFLHTDSSPPSPQDDPSTDNFISLNHSRTLKNLRRAQLPPTPPDTPQPEPESGGQPEPAMKPDLRFKRKRRYIVKSIIDTENSYLDSLIRLDNDYKLV